jgi:hemerythrin superfamily protein
MTAGSADVVEVIKSQHRDVASLLTRVATASTDALPDAFCDLRRMIAVHETAEEEVVYPILRATGEEGKRIADARTAEEAAGLKVLSRLEDLRPGSTAFSTLFEEFRTAVLHHAQAEEASVLPRLLSSQDADRRRKMAETFEIAENAAPTHPHPHAGTGLVSHLVAGPVLSLMDHIRDALHQT